MALRLQHCACCMFAGLPNVSDVHDITTALADSGWGVAFLTGTWAIMLRILMGRHFKAIDTMQATLLDIESRLSAIEGRMKERDINGHGRKG